jgi:hypothetical protein
MGKFRILNSEFRIPKKKKLIQNSKFKIMLELTPIFVLAIIFGFIYGIIQLSIQHKERKLLLEKGADPSIFQAPKFQKATSLRYGLLLIGIALGIFMGSTLAQSTNMPEEASYFSMVFLFGGIALVVSYFLERKM